MHSWWERLAIVMYDLAEAVVIARNILGGDDWVALTDDEKIFSLIAAQPA